MAAAPSCCWLRTHTRLWALRAARATGCGRRAEAAAHCTRWAVCVATDMVSFQRSNASECVAQIVDWAVVMHLAPPPPGWRMRMRLAAPSCTMPFFYRRR